MGTGKTLISLSLVALTRNTPSSLSSVPPPSFIIPQTWEELEEGRAERERRRKEREERGKGKKGEEVGKGNERGRGNGNEREMRTVNRRENRTFEEFERDGERRGRGVESLERLCIRFIRKRSINYKPPIVPSFMEPFLKGLSPEARSSLLLPPPESCSSPSPSTSLMSQHSQIRRLLPSLEGLLDSLPPVKLWTYRPFNSSRGTQFTSFSSFCFSLSFCFHFSPFFFLLSTLLPFSS